MVTQLLGDYMAQWAVICVKSLKTYCVKAQAVADIRWQSIDIAELPEQEMLKFADKIPVLVTAIKTLYYPFSIMDIITR